MKRIPFLVVCATLLCAHASAQISIFNQRGRATQEMTDGGLYIAHPSLANDSVVKVANADTGKEVEATVIRRIPASRDRIADLSRGVWQALDLKPDTDIIISVSPPPRQRVSAPAPDLAKTPPPTAKPEEPRPAAQSKPAPSAQGPNPASNDEYLSLLRDMVVIIKNELQQQAGPTTSVITVYPPYPPQSIISNQPTVTNFAAPVDQPVVTNPAPPNAAYPQAAPPAPVPQPGPRPAAWAAPPTPVPQPSPGAPAVRAAPPATASQPDKDCYANPTPQPTKLQIIPRLPNPNGKEIYRLQVGSFCDPASANALENRLKAAGFNVAREFYNTMHRVIVTGIPAAQVQPVAQRLEALGIKQIWVRQ